MVQLAFEVGEGVGGVDALFPEVIHDAAEVIEIVPQLDDCDQVKLAEDFRDMRFLSSSRPAATSAETFPWCIN